MNSFITGPATVFVNGVKVGTTTKTPKIEPMPLQLLTPGFPIDTFASILRGGAPAEVAADFLMDHSLPLVDVLMLYARDLSAGAIVPGSEKGKFFCAKCWCECPYKTKCECGGFIRYVSENCLLPADFPLSVLRAWLLASGDERHGKLPEVADGQVEMVHERQISLSQLAMRDFRGDADEFVRSSLSMAGFDLSHRWESWEDYPNHCTVFSQRTQVNVKRMVLEMFDDVGIWEQNAVTGSPVEVTVIGPNVEPFDTYPMDDLVYRELVTCRSVLTPGADPGFTELVVRRGYVTWYPDFSPEKLMPIGRLASENGFTAPFRIRPHGKRAFAIDRMMKPVEFLPRPSPWLPPGAIPDTLFGLPITWENASPTPIPDRRAAMMARNVRRHLGNP